MTQRSAKAEILRGMGLLFLFHLGVALAAALLSWIASFFRIWQISVIPGFFLLAPGIAQIFYALPLIVHFKSQRRFNAMSGAIIGAIIALLINGGCFVVVVNSLGGF